MHAVQKCPCLFEPVHAAPIRSRVGDPCTRIAGRTTWYLEPEETQRDLDRFLEHYNLDRGRPGYRLKSRTPTQALRKALTMEELPPVVPAGGTLRHLQRELQPKAGWLPSRLVTHRHRP